MFRVLLMLMLLCGISVSTAYPADLPEKGHINNLLLNNLELHKVARLLSEGSGRTIIVSSQSAGIKVTVFLENVSTLDAIKSICRAYQLWYKDDDKSGIIEITTLEDYRKTADVYSEEVVEVIPVMYPQVERMGDVIQDIFQDRVVWTSPSTADYASDRIDDAMSRMYTIKDTVEEESSSGLSGNSTYSSGGNYNSGSGHNSYSNSYNNNSSGGRNYGSNNRNGNDAANDTKGRTNDMVAGKAMMKQAEDLKEMTGQQLQNLARRRGPGAPDFAEIAGRPGAVFISAMVNTNSLILRSLDKKGIERIKKVIQELDKPTAQVLMELKIMDVSIGKEKAMGIDWLFEGFNDKAIGVYNSLPSSGSIQSRATLSASNASNSAILNANVSGVASNTAVFSMVNDALNFRIKALEDENKLTILGTPTLIVADGEASQLFVGTESTILTQVQVDRTTTNGESNQYVDTTVSPTTQRVKVGTSLFITPQIHPDKTVTIRIFQRNSELGSQKEIRYGGNSDSYFITQDIESRSVTTTAIASDGKVVAVSGLVKEKKGSDTRMIPGVSKIPVVGKLFTSTDRTNSRNELMVLIRPFVLIAPDQAEKVTMDLLRRVSIHPSAKDDLPELGVGRIGDGDKTVLDKDDPTLDEDVENWIRKTVSRIPTYATAGECARVPPELAMRSPALGAAVKLEISGKYLEAVGAYKEAIVESQDMRLRNAATLGAARCLVSMGKFDAALMALDDYSSAAGSEEERLKMSMAGEIFLRMRNAKSAESVLEMALSQIQLQAADPQWVGTVCANLGKAYLLNNKADKARKIYQIAAKEFSQAGDMAAAAACKGYANSCLQ